MKDKLSFFEFTKLSSDEQYHFVFTSGEFIDSFTKNNSTYALYKLWSFYVEVKYDRPTNKIINLVCSEKYT